MNTYGTCEQVEEVLALAGLGALDREDITVDVQRHLAGCESCRRAAATFATTVATLPEALPPVHPPARLRNNIMAQVYAEAARMPAARRRSPLSRLWRSLPASRGFTVATGLAAAAAVVLAVWGSSRSSGTNPQLTSRTYQVAGTAVAPQVSGALYYDATTTRSVLFVHGLQPPDASATPKRAYEVWLIPAHGAPVAAGFLTRQPGGQTWAAALSGNAQAYHVVAATIEPATGSEQPTGPKVLSGTLG